jgi:hypothetical protein
MASDIANLVTGPIAFGLRRRRSKTRHYSPRLDGRSAEARRIKALVKLYRDHLGAVDAIKAVDIQRLAEMETLCASLRASGSQSTGWRSIASKVFASAYGQT